MARTCFFILLFSILAEMFHVQVSIAQEKKWLGPSVDFSHGRLVVEKNKRFLTFEDGQPFFGLGDTAWELFHRLTKDEAERYMENRLHRCHPRERLRNGVYSDRERSKAQSPSMRLARRKRMVV